MTKTLIDMQNKIHGALTLLKTSIYYRLSFRHIGKNTRIGRPLLISNPQYIRVGSNTSIRAGVRLEAIRLNDREPALMIGDNVNIEQNVHIICSSRITIGNNVSITGHCAIVDTQHPYEDVTDPIKVGERIDFHPRPVSIGDGSFLGYGSIVLPGVTIGKNCVVGAHSTVTRDVPDFSVVVGSPARITHTYSHEQMKWIRLSKNDSSRT
jgi:acetyltransferase-like isoleucine patch superfamily enzyme